MASLLDDYVIAISASVMVAAGVILGVMLSRYSRLVKEADSSSRLAKDVWDSMNSRFSVIDTRVIDLMAKTDMLSSRLEMNQASSRPQVTSVQASDLATKASKPAPVLAAVTQEPVASGEGAETEVRVLQMLAQGPRSSAQIREQVGRSREHTARLMKALFDRGLVMRNERTKPYVYTITDSGRSYLAS